jgi:hypothetical protein
MLIEQSQAELNAAQAIQGKCTLTQVVLNKCEMAAFGQEEQFASPFKLNFTHDCSAVQNGRILIVEAKFDFKSVDASPQIAPVFNLLCVYRLAYELQEGSNPTPIQIDAFKKGNAVYNCWPYVREFVQNATARMGFNPPPLPLLRVKVRQEAKPTVSEQPTAPMAETKG